jgi:hypothetical protein
MSRILTALIAAFLLLAATQATAHAGDDYLVPIGVGGKTYTLTVTVDASGIVVTADPKLVTVGKIAAAPPAAPAAPAAAADLDAQKATAVTIPYDDLFRNNEEHVGKTVRYVGKVVEVQENVCILCDNPGYHLRVEVTKGSYGLWDDPLWIEYTGTERFLEDDLVTVWGVVEGLKKYIAVLGNQITIPQITALDVQLGELANPRLAAAPGAASANSNANLRGGPGTGYAVVGSTQAGDALDVTARNAGGDWLQLAGGEWIAAFLVDNAPEAADLPVAAEAPAPPTPAPAAAATAESADAPAASAQNSPAPASSGFASIGQEIEAGGWRFKVSEVHKRKAVYFYDESHIAMGHYLIVVVDATNLQSGTDYFDRNIDPWVTDRPGNVFGISGTASSYARWQLGGLNSIYSDVNPGAAVRMAFAVDLPDSTGDVLLSTDVGQWVELGNFAAMQSEDN